MEAALREVIDACVRALDSAEPQRAMEAVVLEAARNPAVTSAIAMRTKFQSLEDLAIYRSEHLTLLAGALPAKFSAGPHNHNLWSVVGVCSGQEDNEFYERAADGLNRTGAKSVVGPGVLPNPADVIHAISNPLDAPLIVLHAYGGDLFGTPRSNWDPETQREIPFDWTKVRSQQAD